MKMFKAYIEYDQKMEKIELPCDENHIKSVLESLYMTEDKILKPEIFLAEIEDFDELKILEDRFIKLDELNYLAKRLMSFDKMELDTFKAVIADGKYKELKDMINLSFSPNKYILIKDLSNPEVIGKRYFIAKNLGVTEKELLETDFGKIGREVIASSEQKLTPYGIVIENKDVELEETYNGQTFPAYGFYSHLFRAEITYGNNTEYVYMPDDEITIDKAVRRLGAETLDDCMIDIEYGDIIDKEWFDKIKGITYTEGLKAANKVLDYLDQLSSNDLEKLKAITEFADRYDSEAVIKLGENISEFDYFEGAYNMDDLGRELIEQDEDYHIHEDIADYFMYEQYAEDVTREYDLSFTSCGAVILKGPTLTEILGEEMSQEETQTDDFDMTMM